MTMRKVADINVASEDLLPTPRQIKEQLPISEDAANAVFEARQTLQNILDAKDRRLFVVLGPCSIHDLASAREYSELLAGLASRVDDTFILVMRVYFSKPRTTIGWKGFINDPNLDDSFQIDQGLFRAREFLRELANNRVPVGTEALDPIIPQYIDDLVAWHAIGARTTESQTHREMASGLSTPVGFKNGTDGGVEVAINALRAVASPHHFLGINQEGQCAVLRTRGNSYAHIVLRGGDRPNYDSVSIALCEKELEKAGLPGNIMIDCSHGNSFKDPALQPLVITNCVNQIIEGNRSIVGLMIESHINSGRQDIPADKTPLKYGVSITDACLDWGATEKAILDAREKLAGVLLRRTRFEK